MEGIALVPDGDVEWADGRWRALSTAPWLAIPSLARRRGRWIRLRYATGLFDELVRPLIRFRSRSGVEESVPMNGALAGVAEWIGRVPDDTIHVAISPVRGAGPFSFALLAARPVSRLTLLARGLRRRPRMALTAAGARLIGSRGEARHCLKFAALPTAMRDYASWTTQRMRPIDLDGFDRPHGDWSDGPTLHLLMSGPSDAAAHDRMLGHLRAQSYPRWKLHAAESRESLALNDLGDPLDLVAVLHPDDGFAPHGLAAIAEAALANPRHVAFYGDEEQVGPARRLIPRLKPDFSPIFEAEAGYAGAGAFFRLGSRRLSRTIGEIVAAEPSLLGLEADQVGHVRRLVYRRRFRRSPLAPACAPALEGPPPAAAIVIPTRDRPQLLRACLASLRGRTDYPAWEVVVVDNGTTDAEALALLADAARDPRFTILRAPGPFNYAALCNAGAAAARAPLLVFLNNDVTALGEDWLLRLARQAVRPEIGAVGPKLLFPDGRVQHGGDVLGLGETALHAYRLSPDDAGYLEQLAHPREVMAVTGAVQAVERAKFEAVGGFDARRFPVLLNDTDLCLRLDARGWRSLYEPAAPMIHAESASRGYSARPFTLYGAERRNFAEAWLPVIRDDPFFHPALSLYAELPALG